MSSIILDWKIIFDRSIYEKGSFVSPASRDVSDCVAAATKDKHRDVEFFHEIYTSAVTFYGEVEATAGLEGTNRRSAARESAPHCSTITEGRKERIMLDMTCLNISR